MSICVIMIRAYQCCICYSTSSLELFIESGDLEQQSEVLIFWMVDFDYVADFGVWMLLWIQDQVLWKGKGGY